MKVLILAVSLAVMQATPPVPRKATDNAAGTPQERQSNSTSDNAPSQTPTPAVHLTAPNGDKKKGDDEGSKNTENTVRITELPPVSITPNKRDWVDWGYWGFNGLLVIVGGFQVWLLFRTLKAIKRQADIYDEQRKIMEGQLTAMQGQLGEIQKQAAEMEKQTRHLEGSVAAAQTSAEAAKLSADIAARVSIPRFVIEEFGPGDTGAANLEAMLQFPKVSITIKNYGQSPALLKFWTLIFTCEDLPAEPDYWMHPGSGILLERAVVEPNQPYTLPQPASWKRTELSLEDVQAIITHKKNLWAYGFICYDDIFGSRRRLKFCELALNVTEGWIQWMGDLCPPNYRGIQEPPWGDTPSKKQRAEKPDEAKPPN